MPDSLETLRQRFGDRHPYYPRLARLAGGAAAALLLDYLLAQSEATRLEPAAIASATGLNRAELEAARRQLRDRDLLQERLAPDGQGTVGDLNRATLEQRLADFEQWLFQSAPPPETATPETGDRFFPAPRPQPTVATAPHYRFAGPWGSSEELEVFQRALIEHFKIVGERHPADKAFWTIDGLSKGLISTYWDEFTSGQALGSSQQVQRDWEIAPGLPYPAFEEDRISYYRQRGEPIEAAVERARRELRDPQRGQDLWDGFLRKCDRLADEARKAQELGVRTPYLPPAFTERSQPTKASVMAKLAAVAAAVPPAPEPAPLPATPAKPAAERPPVETLQQIYASPLGKQLVEQQLADHPEWNYQVVAGRVISQEESSG